MISTEDMDIEDMNIEEDEKRIIRIIKRIKGNRNRACYQNILEFARREDNNLDRNKIKVTIDNLLSRNIITDINKKKNTPDMESFKIVEEENLENLNIQDEDDENTITSLENFIHDKFYETLINKIREEVKTVVNSETNLLNTNVKANSLKVINPECDFDNKRKDSSDLVNVLLDQIEFLKSELKSKDSIIKILLNDRVSDKSLNDNMKDLTLNKDVTKITSNKVKNSYSYHNGVNSGSNYVNISNESNDNSSECYINDDSFQNNFKEVKRKSNKRSITIIGDSIIKDIKSFKVRNGLPNKESVYVKSFSGATVECMKSHVIPSLKYNPNVIILNAGTNDLRSNKLPEQIAEDILQLALSIKSDDTEIAISGIVQRNDALNRKGLAVNDYLKQKVQQHEISYINNDNINPKMHLNNSRLHLNANGTVILANNFMDFINL